MAACPELVLLALAFFTFLKKKRKKFVDKWLRMLIIQLRTIRMQLGYMDFSGKRHERRDSLLWMVMVLRPALLSRAST